MTAATLRPKTRIAGAVLAAAAMLAPIASAAPAQALEQPQWVLNFANNTASTETPVSLRNTSKNQELKYGSRDYGINLVWGSGTTYQWKFVRPDGAAKAPAYGENLALYNLQNKQYVVYGSRSYGINLVWSSQPSYQWQLKGGPAGSAVPASSSAALFTTVINDSLINGWRPAGISLTWANDGSTKVDYCKRYSPCPF